MAQATVAPDLHSAFLLLVTPEPWQIFQSVAGVAVSIWTIQAQVVPGVVADHGMPSKRYRSFPAGSFGEDSREANIASHDMSSIYAEMRAGELFDEYRTKHASLHISHGQARRARRDMRGDEFAAKVLPSELFRYLQCLSDSFPGD